MTKRLEGLLIDGARLTGTDVAESLNAGKPIGAALGEIDAAADAVQSSIGAIFDNADQDCCARSRILIQQSLSEDFVAALTDRTSQLAVGSPAGREQGMVALCHYSEYKTVFIANN